MRKLREEPKWEVIGYICTKQYFLENKRILQKKENSGEESKSRRYNFMVNS